MKIAICFSGQPRTWKSCYNSWFNLIDKIKTSTKFNEYGVEIDCFLHTWNFNTIPPHLWVKMGFPNINLARQYHEIPQKEIDELISIIKPKKFLIESSEVSDSRKEIVDIRAMKIHPNENKNGSIISWAASQLYGIMKSSELKKDYEIENGFEYDVCIRMRLDSNINEENIKILIDGFNLPLKKKTIYSMHSANTTTFPHDLVGDIFFYSDSHTYDVLSSFFEWIHIIRGDVMWHGVKIEEVFAYYIRMFGINNIRSSVDFEIKRLEYKNINENSDLF
jgi:hypothetical protein